MGVGADVLSAVVDTYQSFASAIIDNASRLTTGILIIIIGYFIAQIIGWFVRKVLYRLNLDKRLRKADLDDSFGKVSIARLFGTLSKWFVFFVFFAIGLSYLNFGYLKTISDILSFWTFIVTIDIILIVLGFIFIDFMLYKIWEIRTKYDYAIQVTARFFLVIIVIFTTLDQQNLDLVFIRTIFLLIFGAILLSASLAIGIGLGVGLSKNMDGIFKRLKKPKR